jgi:hypothetical protein
MKRIGFSSLAKTGLLVLGIGTSLAKASAAPLSLEISNGRAVLIGNAAAEKAGGKIRIHGQVIRQRHSHTSAAGSYLEVRVLDAKGAMLGERQVPIGSVKLGSTSKGYPKAMRFDVDFPSSKAAAKASVVYEGRKT